MSTEHILIIGGGIVGLSTAYFLARRGQAVTLLDDGDFTTSASSGNAGIIALGHPPLPRPGLIRQTLRWAFDPTSPLYVPLRFDPALWHWMWRFSRACGSRRFVQSTHVLSALGRLAGPCLARLLVDESIDCAHQTSGWLEVHRTEAGRAHGRDDARLLRDMGYEVAELSRKELLDREPAFDGSVLGAMHYTQSTSLNPARLLPQLVEAACRRGATVHAKTAVDHLEVTNNRLVGAVTADGRRFTGTTIVLAAGAWTTALAKGIGVKIPMQAGKGYHVNLPRLHPPLHTAAVLADRHIAVTPMGDFVRLAGTMELSGMNLKMHPRRLSMLTEGAAEYLPGVKHATVTSSWCGLRPCTADGLPVIGPAPVWRNLFIATGHAKMGLSLGPITGSLLTEWILDGRPSFDLSLMSPARFA